MHYWTDPFYLLISKKIQVPVELHSIMIGSWLPAQIHLEQANSERMM